MVFSKWKKHLCKSWKYLLILNCLKTIQHFLDEDEAMAFVDIEGRFFLGPSKAVYNKQNQKEGVLAAFSRYHASFDSI